MASLNMFATAMDGWSSQIYDPCTQGAYKSHCHPCLAVSYWRAAPLLVAFLQQGKTLPTFANTIKFLANAKITPLYQPEPGGAIYLGCSDKVYEPKFTSTTLEILGGGSVFEPVHNEDGSIKMSMDNRGVSCFLGYICFPY
jgi:hypothetical protein